MDEQKTLHQEGTGKEKMQQAYKIANKLLRDRLNKEDEENAKILDDLDTSDIIVVTGTYDHIHLVLKHLGIRFTEISQNALVTYDLSLLLTAIRNTRSQT